MFPTRRITTSGGDVFRDEFSLAFDGSNDYVDCGSDSSLDVGTADFSFSVWFKVLTKGGSDYHDIIAKGHTLGVGDGWGIALVESDKRIYFDTNGDVARQNASTAINVWDFNKWHHIVGTRSNSANELKIYLDGVLVATNSSVTNDDVGDASLNFGIGKGENSRYFKGNIADIAYYNKALSASEAKTLYNGREPYNHKEGVCSSNLQAWWRMGDGAFDDFSGSGNGLVTDTADESIGTDLNSTANATSISNESNGTAGGWINGNGSGSNQMATYEASTSNVVNGTYSLHATADNDNDRVYYSFTTVVGKCYQVKLPITITNHHTSDANLRIRCGDAQNGTDHYDLSSYTINPTTDTFEYKTAFIATATTSFLTLRENGGNNNVDFYIDSLSIKELSGNAGVMVNLGNNFEGDTP